MNASEIPVLSISQLTRQLKELVEANFSYVCVVGEVSNCMRASSGHIYLTLKDEDAQLRSVIWRRTASTLKFDIEDGLEVLAAGAIEIYELRGSYQLIIDRLIPQGMGALELAFRQLQEKLAAEGLFDPDRKRPLPKYPRKIALITSPSSAAVRDMLQVITRRWQASDIVILPVAVQGAGAAEEIASALRMVHRISDVDVVITGRGGGSLEDLWAFNEEIVARAVYDCPIPVISAVGHEIDVSISDLVADRRALTPSEAGELVVPLKSEIHSELNRIRDRLTVGLRERANHARLQLDSLSSRRIFRRPFDRIHDQVTRIDELSDHIKRNMARCLKQHKQQLTALSNSLDALSPLKVLGRGYSMTRQEETGDIVYSADQILTGDRISTLLGKGSISSQVLSVDKNSHPALNMLEENNSDQ